MPEPGSWSSAPTALVVDDDADQAQVVGFLLQRLGFQIVTAYDGLAATMQALKVDPSVIMLDYEMPAGDGGAVYKRLRGFPRLQKTPIVFISARKAAEVTKGIPAGPTVRFLPKPVAFNTLCTTLAEIVPPEVWAALPARKAP